MSMRAIDYKKLPFQAKPECGPIAAENEAYNLRVALNIKDKNGDGKVSQYESGVSDQKFSDAMKAYQKFVQIVRGRKCTPGDFDGPDYALTNPVHTQRMKVQNALKIRTTLD